MENELLIKKAHEGYTVCYAEQCPLRQQCLRWQVGQHVPNSDSTYRCVNPHFEGVATTGCSMYRDDQKVRFAKGMTHIFTLVGDLKSPRDEVHITLRNELPAWIHQSSSMDDASTGSSFATTTLGLEQLLGGMFDAMKGGSSFFDVTIHLKR